MNIEGRFYKKLAELIDESPEKQYNGYIYFIMEIIIATPSLPEAMAKISVACGNNTLPLVLTCMKAMQVAIIELSAEEEKGEQQTITE